MGKQSSFLILFPLLALGILVGSRSPLSKVLLVVYLLLLGLWLYFSSGSARLKRTHWLVLGLGMFVLGQLSGVGEQSWIHPKEGEYRGLVYSVQTLSFETRVLVRLKPSRLQVAVHLPADVAIQIGDSLSFQGVIAQPPKAPNPGVFSYREYLSRQGVFGLSYPADFQIQQATKTSLLRRIRLKFKDNLERHLVDPGLVQALVLGDRDGLGTARKELWRELGISHLLAISGMHVGLLALVLGWLVQKLPFKPIYKFFLTQVVLCGYIVLAGSGASTWRAFLAGLLGSYGSLRGRSVDPLHLWAFIGWLLLLGQPSLIFDPGFTLSFAASGGIILWAPNLRFTIRSRIITYIVSSLTISLVAQISLAPLLIHYFGEIAVLGSLSTLLFLPLVVVLLVGGLGVALGLGSLGFTPLVNQVMGIVEALERLLTPYAWQWVPRQVSLIQILIWWLFFVYAGWCLRRPRLTKPRRTLHQLAKGFVAVVVITSLPPVVFNPLEITAINVGQGDSYYIRTPSGRHLLIDGGGDSPYWQERGRNVGEQRLVPYLRHRQVERLDYVILSHPHEDHLFGLLAVLEHFEVGLVIDNGHAHTSPSYLRYLELIEAKQIPYHVARGGDRINLGDGITLNVLYPEELLPALPSPYNNNSLLLRLDYGGLRALFTGDLEKPVLYDLAELDVLDLKAQWLKVPHHGSNSSFSEEFYRAVQPRWATISVGPNSFGHPHQEVVEYLNRSKIRWATTEQGPVTFFIWWGLWGRLRGPRS